MNRSMALPMCNSRGTFTVPGPASSTETSKKKDKKKSLTRRATWRASPPAWDIQFDLGTWAERCAKAAFRRDIKRLRCSPGYACVRSMHWGVWGPLFAECDRVRPTSPIYECTKR